jgi:S1-C subfamily serine protease
MAMHRALGLIAIIVLALMPMLALRTLLGSSAMRPVCPLLNEIIESVLADPVEDITNRAPQPAAILSREPATGLPIIRAIGTNSPFERAGLRVGDIITKVNGWATTNRSLAEIEETMQWVGGETVTLSIERTGATNRECVMQ